MKLLTHTHIFVYLTPFLVKMHCNKVGTRKTWIIVGIKLKYAISSASFIGGDRCEGTPRKQKAAGSKMSKIENLEVPFLKSSHRSPRSAILQRCVSALNKTQQQRKNPQQQHRPTRGLISLCLWTPDQFNPGGTGTRDQSEPPTPVSVFTKICIPPRRRSTRCRVDACWMVRPYCAISC